MKSFDRDYIHKEKSQEEYLKTAVEAAKASGQIKSDFISRMSHDIRTPLNTIIGMTDLASVNIDNKRRVQDCLKKISLSGNYLLRLINEILDMNKIQNGMPQLKESETNIREIIDDMLAMVHPQICAKNHALEIKVHNLEHEDILGDSLRIKEVLVNLMSNAIKYTENGGKITLEVTEKESPEKETSLYEFIVSDNGIGMDSEFVKHIFDPFSRAENAETVSAEGTGLGMAIARSIAQMMGGDISVNSVLGEGSEFTVTMNLKHCQKDHEKMAAATMETGGLPQNIDFSGHRVLIVEDNNFNLEIAAEIIETTGAKVETANNGLAAVKKLEQIPKDYFDLIFMDIRMPKMDGYQAARVIRNLDRSDMRTVPIIAMTANAFADDIAMSRDAGMNDHIAKPLKMNMIFQVMEKWLAKSY